MRHDRPEGRTQFLRGNPAEVQRAERAVADALASHGVDPARRGAMGPLAEEIILLLWTARSQEDAIAGVTELLESCGVQQPNLAKALGAVHGSFHS